MPLASYGPVILKVPSQDCQVNLKLEHFDTWLEDTVAHGSCDCRGLETLSRPVYGLADQERCGLLCFPADNFFDVCE